MTPTSENLEKNYNCFLCSKKIKLIEAIALGKCKCQNIFCKKHINQNEHNCTYNYQNNFKDFLSSNMTPIISKKIDTF